MNTFLVLHRITYVVYWPSAPPDMPFQRRGSAYSIGVGELGSWCETTLKSHGTLIDRCIGREWPVNFMTVISARRQSNMPFQRLSGRLNNYITWCGQEVSELEENELEKGVVRKATTRQKGPSGPAVVQP